MKRLILLGCLIASLIMQNVWADSLSVACQSSNSPSNWTGWTSACTDDGSNAQYAQSVASESDYLYWRITDPSIASAQVIDSIQVHIKGSDNNSSYLHIFMCNYDEIGIGSALGTPLLISWNGTETYRTYGGQGDWNSGGTVTGQNLTDGQYVFVLTPEDGFDYSTDNIYVNDAYFTFFWHTASGSVRRNKIVKMER